MHEAVRAVRPRRVLAREATAEAQARTWPRWASCQGAREANAIQVPSARDGHVSMRIDSEPGPGLGRARPQEENERRESLWGRPPVPVRRGRDARCRAPPAQIPASGFPALGSCLSPASGAQGAPGGSTALTPEAVIGLYWHEQRHLPCRAASPPATPLQARPPPSQEPPQDSTVTVARIGFTLTTAAQKAGDVVAFSPPHTQSLRSQNRPASSRRESQGQRKHSPSSVQVKT